MTTSCWAVVVAAGRGTRLGMDRNKVFVEVDGQTVLSRCLHALEKTACFDGMVLVLSSSDMDLYRDIVKREGACDLVKSVVEGGNTRQQSVYNGLKAVPEDVGIVAIHDAARFLVPASVVRATVNAAREYGSGVASTRVSDTIKVIDESGCAISTPDRARLRAVQTPQTFRRQIIMDAHEKARAQGVEATDDAALVERYAGGVHLVETPESALNRKLTTRDDLACMCPMKPRETRVGMGSDAHRLTAGRDLVLCGERVPYAKGLLGHSDADVAVHALMDAMLGALALADIGAHFPDSDERYLNISSVKLLTHVKAMIDERGWRVTNADITIVAQAPRLAPYIIAMRENVARALCVNVDRISVKATTTEGMGFEGRGEGISATAVVLLENCD